MPALVGSPVGSPDLVSAVNIHARLSTRTLARRVDGRRPVDPCPPERGRATGGCVFAGANGDSHLDALVPRVIHRAQRRDGRVDGGPDLDRPFAGIQIGLVDWLI